MPEKSHPAGGTKWQYSIPHDGLIAWWTTQDPVMVTVFSSTPLEAVKGKSKRIAIVCLDEASADKAKKDVVAADKAWKDRLGQDCEFFYCAPRGVESSRWTRKNGPNYIERSHALLGRTVDAGRVFDVMCVARSVAEDFPNAKIELAGEGANGVICAYAAALEDSINGIGVVTPPSTLMDKDAPQFLNALRVCDVPDALGLIAPRPLTIITKSPEVFERTKAIYEAAGAADKLKITNDKPSK
jgi:hypothetical protein